MSYSREKALKKLEELQQRRANSVKKDFYSVKPGPNNVRVLSNWKGEPDGDFFRETAYHKNLGPDRDKQAVCLIREGGDFCPVCDYIKKLYSTKVREDAELAKSIKAQHRVLFNVVDLDDSSKGVQVWMTGSDILEQILGYDANPKYEDVTDPENGRNLVVNFTEKTKSKTGFNDYKVQPDPERSAISNPEWLMGMVDLDSIVKVTSVENMLELLGVESEDEKPETVPAQGRNLRPVELEKTIEPEKTVEAPVVAETKPVVPSPASSKASNIQELMAKLREQRGNKK
jgi:hypothetical protein